jgi:hypothetical protein
LRRGSLGLFVCMLLWATQALAQTPTQPLDAAIAEALALREQGRDVEALALLTRAWESTRSPRARAQMARAEQALGRWLDARAHMAEALASREDPWIAARVASLEDERAGMEAHLGRLEVLGVPDGAEVQVDDRPARRTPLAEPLWSAVGTVVLTVRMPGFFPVARRVVVDAGGVARETVSLVPMQPVGTPTISPAAPPVTLPPRVEVRRVVPAATHPRRVLGLAGVIGGAAFLLGGASAHVARELTLDGAVRDGCALTAAGGVTGPAGCTGRVMTVEVSSAFAVAGYVTGALLLGAGLVLWFTAPRSDVVLRGWTCAPGPLGAGCVVRF